MDTKSLLFGIGGSLLGGLIVSIAATTLNKPNTEEHGSSKTSLESKTSDKYDKAFLSEMITHHQGALDMAKEAEAKAKHNEIKQLAREIIIAQEKEINLMKEWQVKWGYAGRE